MNNGKQNERSLWGYIAVSLISSALVYSCTKEEQQDTYAPAPPAFIPTPPAPARSIPEDLTQSPIKTISPKHRYSAREDTTYYYEAELNDEDKKQGIAATDAVPVQYMGKDQKDHYVLFFLRSGLSATCTNPCKVIHYSDGSTVTYREESIIGAAFYDAQRGFLRIHRYSNPHSTPAPLSATEVIASTEALP